MVGTVGCPCNSIAKGLSQAYFFFFFLQHWTFTLWSYGLLGCSSVSSCRWVPTFWRNTLPLSLGLKWVWSGCSRLYRPVTWEVANQISIVGWGMRNVIWTNRNSERELLQTERNWHFYWRLCYSSDGTRKSWKRCPVFRVTAGVK
jgi:hypothetical protein